MRIRFFLPLLLLLAIPWAASACGGSVVSSAGQTPDDSAQADAGVDAEAPAAADAPVDGHCPAGEYLLIPCCGGYDDTACSNGDPAPLPFCTSRPLTCDGPVCYLDECEGIFDSDAGSLGCTCI